MAKHQKVSKYYDRDCSLKNFIDIDGTFDMFSFSWYSDSMRTELELPDYELADIATTPRSTADFGILNFYKTSPINWK